MGKYIFDQFSLLHFATGVIMFFWNISLKNTIIINVIFEILENSKIGMTFINKYLTIWPGGKPTSDSIINGVSDIIFAILGWNLAYKLDSYYYENILVINKYKQ